MIERLAEKWATETGGHFEELILKSDARWWLNALEGDHECPEHVRRWLRAQINEEQKDDGT